MATIFDIAQLTHLRTVAEQLHIEFELHGGTAFRFALHKAKEQANDGKTVDLFDLTPFTADIDLLHSGTDTQTNYVLETILRIVPNADCFRWEVRSQNQNREFRDDSEYSHQIPARRLSLMADGVSDPLNGLDDIRTKRFRFICRESFEQSPLFLKGRNLAVFAALLYLQTLFEADLSESQWMEQPGLRDALEIFAQAVSPHTQIALEQSPYLRTRLTYLLMNCLAVAPRNGFILRSMLDSFWMFLWWLSHEQFPISSNLSSYLDSLERGRPLVLSLSSWLGRDSDRHRLPFATETWYDKRTAHELFTRFPFFLAPQQTILMASRRIRLDWGKAVCPQEFVYFALPHDDAMPDISQFKDTDLSMVAAVRGWWKAGWPFSSRNMYSFPCIVQRCRSKANGAEQVHSLLIRANTMMVYNVLARLPGADTQFFLIGEEQ